MPQSPPTTEEPVSFFETNAGSFNRRALGAQRRSDPPEHLRRRVMDVEDVLTWAYRDELPKRSLSEGGTLANSIAGLMELGTAVDSWGGEPGFPLAMGEPHPDALLVDAAVQRLGEIADLPLDKHLGIAPELAALGVNEGDAMRRALLGAIGTVVRYAKFRKRPFWTKSLPVGEGMRGPNGKPIVAVWSSVQSDGIAGTVFHDDLVTTSHIRKDLYATGAFCPLEFTPEPQSFADERAEYAAWWAALDWLATELQGKLASIAVIAPGAPRRPWVDESEVAKPPQLFSDPKAPIYQAQARKTAEAQRRLGLRRHRDSWTRRTTAATREVAGARSYSVKLVRA